MATNKTELVEPIKELHVASTEEKMVIHMNIKAHQILSMLMRPPSHGKDWKSLADLMGFTNEEIVNLECDMDPVESVIRRWERQKDSTINRLVSYLETLGRNDVIEDLKNFIDETPFPNEHKKRVLEKRQQRPAGAKRLTFELEELSVSDEIYDGFICYAKEDRYYANEMLNILEGPPYNLKICIDYRDYVPGYCMLNQTAQIIEDRCKRIVAILTPNFTTSPQAGFQVKIALNLSPDASKGLVVPVVYEKCEIPRILHHIWYLDKSIYGNDDFWTKLAKSLGYVVPCKAAGTRSPLIMKKKKK